MGVALGFDVLVEISKELFALYYQSSECARVYSIAFAPESAIVATDASLDTAKRHWYSEELVRGTVNRQQDSWELTSGNSETSLEPEARTKCRARQIDGYDQACMGIGLERVVWDLCRGILCCGAGAVMGPEDDIRRRSDARFPVNIP